MFNVHSSKSNTLKTDPSVDLDSFAPKLRKISKRDPTTIKLYNLLKSAEQAVVHATSISSSATEELKLYCVEMPKTKANQRLVNQGLVQELRNLSQDKNIKCFLNWKDTAWYRDKNGRTAKSFNRRLETPDLSPNNIDLDPDYIDLTDRPFFSIDSMGVRVANKPVYGDIDDAFHIQELNDGYKMQVAFADITWLSKLEFSDNLVRNSLRYGYTLYGANGSHQPMIGLKAEQLCSLLENQDRFAWIVEFKISNRNGVDNKSVNIFRAKIRNRMQMDYETTTEDAYTPELSEALKNVRKAAHLLQTAGKQGQAQMFKLGAETINSQAVAQFMIHSRNIIARYMASRGYPSIYRIQYLSTRRRDLRHLHQVLERFDCNVPDGGLRSPQSLSALLVHLLSSQKKKEVQAGINIFDYLLGKACYCSNPSAHESGGFEPYAELKGLRKLSGFVTQHILKAMMQNQSPESLTSLVRVFARLANERRREISDLQSFWAYRKKEQIVRL